ncbi:MAG: ABC transporter permease [Clostridiales bacterium]|nr:ABC transporter permease [Clostridiales bacterium]
MWKKKLKFKKVQFLLIGIMLFVTSCVLSTCIGFSLEPRSYVKRRFSPQSCPDAYIYAKDSSNLKEHFQDASVWANIKEVHSLNGKSVTIPILHKNTNISSVTNMMCLLKDEKIFDYMERTEGDLTSKQPGDFEVWIPKTMASSYKIKVGDHLRMNYETPVELTVTCIYTATFAPSERLTIMANIVNENTLKLFQSEPDAGILAVNLIDNRKEKYVKMVMQDEYSLISFDRKSLSDYITKISNVVGLVSAAAAYIVFLAALFIIRFIINNDIRKEMRFIGIYKSLGYSLNMITGFYLKAYLFIGSIAILLGSIVSVPIVSKLIASLTQTLGGFELSLTSWFVVAGVTIALTACLTLSGWITLNKLKKISPVEAISIGHRAGEQKFKKSVIASTKSPFSTQVNEIWKHKRRSFVTLLVLIVSMYLILFFASSYCACNNVYDNANIWLACPKFNCIVTGNVNEEVQDVIVDSKYVDSVVFGTCFYYPAITVVGYEGNSRNINFYVFSNTQEDVTKVPLSQGTNPKRVDEISVTSQLLHSLHKSIGDYVTMRYGGQEQQYLICGTFESMEVHTVMMTVDAMKALNAEYKAGNCYVQLKENEEFIEFKSDLENKFSDLSVDREWSALKSAVDAIEKMLTSVMAIMLIVFILFVVIAIINVLVLTIHSKYRQYGILKSLGFTTRYIISQNICYITILLGAATVISLVIHLLFSKYLFSRIVIDALVYTASLPYLCLFGSILLIMIITILFSLPIKKITPVSLMEE